MPKSINHIKLQGIIATDGEVWHEQRRFTLRHLRDFRFGKTSLEDQIAEEIQDLILDIVSTSNSDPDQIVDFQSVFSLCHQHSVGDYGRKPV